MNRDFILPGVDSSGAGVLVPPMSSTSQDGFEISSVPEHASTYPKSAFYHAFDWNYASRVPTSSDYTNCAVWLNYSSNVYITIKLKSPKRVGALFLVNPPSAVFGFGPANLYALKGSKNGADYEDIPISVFKGGVYQTAIVNAGRSANYKYYKVTLSPTSEFMCINELALIGG